MQQPQLLVSGFPVQAVLQPPPSPAAATELHIGLPVTVPVLRYPGWSGALWRAGRIQVTLVLTE